MKIRKSALLLLVITMIFSGFTPAFASEPGDNTVVESAVTEKSKLETAITAAEELLKSEDLVDEAKAPLEKAIEAAKAELAKEDLADEDAVKAVEALQMAMERATSANELAKAIKEAEEVSKDANLLEGPKTVLTNAIAKAKEVLNKEESVKDDMVAAKAILSGTVETAKDAIKAKVDADKLQAEIDKKIADAKAEIEKLNKADADKNKTYIQDLQNNLLRQREQLRRLQKENKDVKSLKDEVKKLQDTLSKLVEKKEEKKVKSAVSRDDNFAVFSLDNVYYTEVVNGVDSLKQMDAAAYGENGRTFMPLRYAGYALGIDVDWNQATRQATFVNRANEALEKNTIVYDVNSNTVYKNGQPVFLETGFRVKNGRTYASIRDISTLFGGTTGDINDGVDNTIEWMPNERAIAIYKQTGPNAVGMTAEEKALDSVEVKNIKQGTLAKSSILSTDFDTIVIEADVKKAADADVKFYLVKGDKVLKGYRGNELVETVKGTEGTIKFEVYKNDVKSGDRFDILAVAGSEKKTFEGTKLVTELPNLNGYVTTAGHGYFLQIKATMDIEENVRYNAVVVYGKDRYAARFDKDGNLVHEDIRVKDGEKFAYVLVADEFNNLSETKFNIPNFETDTRIDVEKPEIGRNFLYIKAFGKDVSVDIEVYEKSTGYDLTIMRNVPLADNGWKMVELRDYFNDNFKLNSDMIIKIKVVGQDGYSYIYEI